MEIIKDKKLIIEQIYDKYAESLYRYALSLLFDINDAEDVIQQVFINILNTHRLKNIDSIRAYLQVAVRNQCYKIITKKKKIQEIQDELKERTLFEYSEKQSEFFEEKEWIESVLKKLPVEQREVCYLKVFEEMTFREISELTGNSLNTISSRYQYAMNKLKAIMGKSGKAC